MSNIFKYYVAYQLVVERQAERDRARQALRDEGAAGTARGGAEVPARLSE